MKLDIHLAYTMVFCLTLLAVLGYVKSTRDRIKLDDAVFQYVGMARLPVSEEVYTPVYKRLK